MIKKKNIIVNEDISIDIEYSIIVLNKNRQNIGVFTVWEEVQKLAKTKNLDLIQIKKDIKSKKLVVMLIDKREFLSIIKKNSKKKSKKNIKIFRIRDRISDFDLSYRLKRINKLIESKKYIIKVIYKIYKYKNTTREENVNDFNFKILNKINSKNYKTNILPNNTIIVFIYNSSKQV